MTETIEGIGIASITNALVTENGSHMLLNVRKGGGDELSLAFPAASLASLLTLTAKCASRVDEKKAAAADGGAVAGRRAILAEDWAIHAGDDQRLVLSLTLAGGAELWFSLPAQNRQQIVSVEQLLGRRSKEGNGSAS